MTTSDNRYFPQQFNAKNVDNVRNNSDVIQRNTGLRVQKIANWCDITTQ